MTVMRGIEDWKGCWERAQMRSTTPDSRFEWFQIAFGLRLWLKEQTQACLEDCSTAADIEQIPMRLLDVRVLLGTPRHATKRGLDLLLGASMVPSYAKKVCEWLNQRLKQKQIETLDQESQDRLVASVVKEIKTEWTAQQRITKEMNQWIQTFVEHVICCEGLRRDLEKIEDPTMREQLNTRVQTIADTLFTTIRVNRPTSGAQPPSLDPHERSQLTQFCKDDPAAIARRIEYGLRQKLYPLEPPTSWSVSCFLQSQLRSSLVAAASREQLL